MTGEDHEEIPGLSAGMGTGLNAGSSEGPPDTDVQDTLPRDEALRDEVPRVGLSWSWDLDVVALLDAVKEPAPWNRSARPPGGSTTVEIDGTDQVDGATARPRLTLLT